MDDDTIAAERYIPTKHKRTIPCNRIPAHDPIHHELKTIKQHLDQYKLTHPAAKRKSVDVSLLKSLKDEYPSVIFKATDKNLGLAALTLEHYDSLVMEHLSNDTNYQLVASDWFQRSRLERSLLSQYDRFTDEESPTSYPFDDHEIEFLQKQGNFQFPKFHCLPKLHKKGPLKGRPIAGAVNWITTPISRILDLRLQDLLYDERFSCILKNSQQLVEDMQLANSHLPPDLDTFYFITGDVQSLYPNIDTELLKKFITDLDFALEPLVEFVCTNSYVEYAGRIYHQKNGIAMGTNAAVSLANIYMALLVDQKLSQVADVFYYKRYIDDLFIIWKGTPAKWKLIAQALNRLNPTIKIDFSTPSLHSVDFLDITVSMCPWYHRIQTQIYQKSLNRYLYITPESCHVPHMFSGFIKGELTRYARLCSSVWSYKAIKKQFYQRLVDRGYSRRYLNSLFVRHRWTARHNPDTSPNWKPILPFVVRYSKRSNFRSVELLFKRLEHSFDEYFTHPKLLLVYSRSRNINDLATSSALTPKQISLLGNH